MTVELKNPQTADQRSVQVTPVKSDVLIAQNATVGSPAADLERIYKSPASNTSGSQIMRGKNGTPPGPNAAPGASYSQPYQLAPGGPGATPTGVPMPFGAGSAGLTQGALAKTPDGGAQRLNAMIATKEPVAVFLPETNAVVNLRYDEKSGDVFASDPNRPELGETKWTSLNSLVFRDLKVDQVVGGKETLARKYPELARETGIGDTPPVREQTPVGPPEPNAAQRALIRRDQQQTAVNNTPPQPEKQVVETKAETPPGQPSRVNGVDATRAPATQELLNVTAAETRDLNAKSNTTLSIVYPVKDPGSDRVTLERFDDMTPVQANRLLESLESQNRLPEGFTKEKVFLQNGIGGTQKDGTKFTPQQDLTIRDGNLYFETLSPNQVTAALQKSVPPMNGKVGTVFSPDSYGDLLSQTVPANVKERGNVSLAVPVQMTLPYDTPLDADSKPDASAKANATLLYPDLTPSEAGALLKAFSDQGILRSSVDGVLAQNGLSQDGL